MPNWNENHFMIVGDETKMKPIIDKVDEIKKNGLLDTLAPTPKELKETKSPTDKTNQELVDKYGFDNWYEWRCFNYGTKWIDWREGDEIPVEIEKVKGEKNQVSMSISSDTPWNSPSNGLSYLAHKFKGLLFMNLSIEEQMIWGSFEFYQYPFVFNNNFFGYDKIHEDIKKFYHLPENDDEENEDTFHQHLCDHSMEFLYQGIKRMNEGNNTPIERLLTKYYNYYEGD